MANAPLTADRFAAALVECVLPSETNRDRPVVLACDDEMAEQATRLLGIDASDAVDALTACCTARWGITTERGIYAVKSELERWHCSSYLRCGRSPRTGWTRTRRAAPTATTATRQFNPELPEESRTRSYALVHSSLRIFVGLDVVARKPSAVLAWVGVGDFQDRWLGGCLQNTCVMAT